MPHESGKRPAAPAGEQRNAVGVRRKVGRVEARRAAVVPVRQCEKARHIAVARARSGEQRQAASVHERQLAAAYRLYAHAVGLARELQRAAQVRVRQGERGIAQLGGARKQLVDVGRAQPERVEALAVKFRVSDRHDATAYAAADGCRYQSPARSSLNRVSRSPSPSVTQK